MAAASVPAPASTPVGTPVGAEAAVSSPDLESGGAEGSVDLVGTQDIESMDSESARLKRAREGDEDFIMPNRCLKQPPPPSPGLHLPLSDGFRAMLGDTPK